jgi:nitroreductase
MSEVPAPFTLLRDLFEQRSSVRGFLSTPLPLSQLHDVFAAAQRAPSWCNIQPWRVIVTGPEETRALTSALAAASATCPPCPEVPFPSEYPSPYQERRRACGRALYQAMGIARDDAPRRREAWLQNYRAFNAPHLAIVTCDRRLGAYAYLDVGVWLGYVLAASAALGLATCPMASIASFPAVLRAMLPISNDDVILFGLALGMADPDVTANQCRTSREPVQLSVQFLGL